MNWLGVHLSLLIGEKIPSPAPPFVAEALQSAEVTHGDQGPSGFQLTFHVGRSSIVDLVDYRLLTNPLLKPFNRVILVVRFAVDAQVLMDGIITNQQLAPGNEPGSSTLTLTGEDVSVMMALEANHSQPYPSQSDCVIVTTIIGRYNQYGLKPPQPPAAVPSFPDPSKLTPNQPIGVTDRDYIQQLAQRHGYVFYVTPGPAPSQNFAYWGPPNRLDIPQRALSVNMGPDTNIESINFQYNALAPQAVTYLSEDGSTRTIDAPSPSRVPLVRDRAKLQRTWYMNDIGGLDDTHRKERAQGMVDRSLDEVVTATGSLDALRYNGLLKPRGLVGVRGAGQSYDGSYYVKSVTHSIRKGEYKQNFTLTREGTGILIPLVKP